MVNGQVNLYDAIRKQVDFKQGEKQYKLRTDRTLPTLIVRPRGWHLEEKHVTVDGEPISGSSGKSHNPGGFFSNFTNFLGSAAPLLWAGKKSDFKNFLFRKDEMLIKFYWHI